MTEILRPRDHGNVFLAVMGDGGCSSWENSGDDQLSLYLNGKLVIYDERERFHNDNYDVSFFASRARLSPDGSRVAYTAASQESDRRPAAR